MTGAIPHGRFVPFDNNLGQLNVAPVPGGGGARELAATFTSRAFWFNNPLDRSIEARIETSLSSFLQKRDWKLELLNPGGRRFTLGPRADQRITLKLHLGGDFTAEDVRSAEAEPVIELISLADGRVVGGMTYAVDPMMVKPAVERLPGREREQCGPVAGKLLDCLGWPSGDVKCVRVSRVTIDIDLGKKDC